MTVADDIVTRLRCLPVDCDGTCWNCMAADEIERLRAAGDALGAFVMRRLPHDGWTTADRDFAAVVLDAWEEARRG